MEYKTIQQIMNEDLPRVLQSKKIQELIDSLKEQDPYVEWICDDIKKMHGYFYLNHPKKQKITGKWFKRKITEKNIEEKLRLNLQHPSMDQIPEWGYQESQAFIKLLKAGIIVFRKNVKNPYQPNRTLSMYSKFNGFDFIKLRKQCANKYNKPRDT